MNDSTDLTRYLLGELSEDEQTALEERFAGDPEVFDQIAKAESDLVDDYVRGKLEPGTRERFELVYLAHPQRRKRVRFAEALLTVIDRAESFGAAGAASSVTSDAGRRSFDWLFRSNRVPGYALAALLIAAGIWLAFDARRPESAQQQATRANHVEGDLARDAHAAGVPRTDQTSTAPQAVVVLALGVGSGVRGGDTSGPSPLVLPPGTTEVRVQLTMRASDYPTYRVILQRADGAEVLRRDGLRPVTSGSAPIITIGVPAAGLESGDYILTLQGASGAGEFEDLSRSLIRADKR